MATEKRLIDANGFASGWMLAKFTKVNGKMRLTKTKRLQDVPTVDAMEVVRCKDCELRGNLGCPMFFEEQIEWDDYGYIEWDYVPHDHTTDDGFCSYGERKDNETNNL